MPIFGWSLFLIVVVIAIFIIPVTFYVVERLTGAGKKRLPQEELATGD